MDTARYYLALLLVIPLPPAVLFWYVVHPFVAFWRRLGPIWTYALVGIGCFALMVPLWTHRVALLGADLGTRWWTVVLGAVLYVAGVAVWRERRKHLTISMLTGLPQIDPRRPDNRLLTEGIYGLIRHPRYVEFTLGMIGLALVANHLGAYVVVAITVVALLGVVVVEERELEARFGDEYRDYRARVPRFVPRRGAGKPR